MTLCLEGQPASQVNEASGAVCGAEHLSVELLGHILFSIDHGYSQHSQRLADSGRLHQESRDLLAAGEETPEGLGVQRALEEESRGVLPA